MSGHYKICFKNIYKNISKIYVGLLMICESPGEIPGCDAKSYVCKHSELSCHLPTILFDLASKTLMITR